MLSTIDSTQSPAHAPTAGNMSSRATISRQVKFSAASVAPISVERLFILSPLLPRFAAITPVVGCACTIADQSRSPQAEWFDCDHALLQTIAENGARACRLDQGRANRPRCAAATTRAHRNFNKVDTSIHCPR